MRNFWDEAVDEGNGLLKTEPLGVKDYRIHFVILGEYPGPAGLWSPG